MRSDLCHNQRSHRYPTCSHRLHWASVKRDLSQQQLLLLPFLRPPLPVPSAVRRLLQLYGKKCMHVRKNDHKNKYDQDPASCKKHFLTAYLVISGFFADVIPASPSEMWTGISGCRTRLLLTCFSCSGGFPACLLRIMAMRRPPSIVVCHSFSPSYVKISLL